MLTLQCGLHGNPVLGALPSEERRASPPRFELVHPGADRFLLNSRSRFSRLLPRPRLVEALGG
jgi:hypothetical protein